MFWYPLQLTTFCWSLACVFFINKSSTITDCFWGSTTLPFIWNPFIRFAVLKHFMKNIWHETTCAHIWHKSSHVILILVYKMCTMTAWPFYNNILLWKYSSVRSEHVFSCQILSTSNCWFANVLFSHHMNNYRSVIQIINKLQNKGCGMNINGIIHRSYSTKFYAILDIMVCSYNSRRTCLVAVGNLNIFEWLKSGLDVKEIFSVVVSVSSKYTWYLQWTS